MAHTHVSKYQGQKPADSLLPATSETWRMTSVIQNQLTEITGLCLFREERQKRSTVNPEGKKNEPNMFWNKLRQGRNKRVQTGSFYLHPQSLQSHWVTLGRCLICHRWRHSERIKRWNTDTLATGGLHLDISRWVRPLDLHCFPMETSEWFS